MIPLSLFNKQTPGFADFLAYEAFVDEGVLLNKDGSVSVFAWYFGPDTASATEDELDDVSRFITTAFGKLEKGWTINVDAIRVPAKDYPESQFPEPVSLLIDDERMALYRREGAHYENKFALTLTYQLPTKTEQMLFNAVQSDKSSSTGGLDTALLRFNQRIGDVFDKLRGTSWMELRPMSSVEAYCFLRSCLTGDDTPVRLPRIPLHLDYLLAAGAGDFIGGAEPRIGRKHVVTLSFVDYPGRTEPQILEELNLLPYSYRWSTRFIVWDNDVIRKKQAAWKGKASGGLKGALKQRMGDDAEPDLNAANLAHDALIARTLAEDGAVKFGYYTSTVVLHGDDREKLLEAAAEFKKTIESKHGFEARIEGSLNATEAFLGSLPAHLDYNVRKALIHTMNLAHLLPIAAVWAGPQQHPASLGTSAKYPPGSPPLMVANTNGATPFRLSLHSKDVGHTLIVGPSGAGKSTLLGMLAAQHMRYPNARVYAFDKGYSMYVLANAIGGGVHYDIRGEHESLSFAPLADIDSEAELAWALTWVEELMVLQGYTPAAEDLDDIYQRLKLIAAGPVEYRTLENLMTKLGYSRRNPDTDLRALLKPYTAEGSMGTLLDSHLDSMQTSSFQVFELEHLWALGGDTAKKWILPVLSYLFHKIEKQVHEAGYPTLIFLDEAWAMLDSEFFRQRIRSWLKELRKHNAAVVFATQNLNDVINSPLVDVLTSECPTTILLANPGCDKNEFARKAYDQLGLSATQISQIANASKKRDYYFIQKEDASDDKGVTRRRMIQLELGPVALAFTGVADKENVVLARELIARYGRTNWVHHWLLAQAARADRYNRPSASLRQAAEVYLQYAGMQHAEDPSAARP